MKLIANEKHDIRKNLYIQRQNYRLYVPAHCLNLNKQIDVFKGKINPF